MDYIIQHIHTSYLFCTSAGITDPTSTFTISYNIIIYNLQYTLQKRCRKIILFLKKNFLKKKAQKNMYSWTTGKKPSGKKKKLQLVTSSGPEIPSSSAKLLQKHGGTTQWTFLSF